MIFKASSTEEVFCMPVGGMKFSLSLKSCSTVYGISFYPSCYSLILLVFLSSHCISFRWKNTHQPRLSQQPFQPILSRIRLFQRHLEISDSLRYADRLFFRKRFYIARNIEVPAISANLFEGDDAGCACLIPVFFVVGVNLVDMFGSQRVLVAAFLEEARG